MKSPCVILITGASSGIGEALARHYAAPGITLVLTGRNAERLEKVAADCRCNGAVVHPEIIDVCDAEAMRQWILSLDKTQNFDLVIANAGISGGTGLGGEDEAQVRSIFDTNVNGVFNTILPILPQMCARHRGQIAIVASLAGFSGWPGAPAYSASKGAVRLYGEALRGAVADEGVAINVVCPGFVVSRITDANHFNMPFLMPTNQAAKIISRGLSQNRGRIAFPWQTRIIVGILALLPYRAVFTILKKTPKKSAQNSP